MRGEARLGSVRWNRLYAESDQILEHLKEVLKDELYADGLPPFTAQKSESEEYHTLITMAQVNDPRFVNDVEAKRRLAELSLKYGPPPPYKVPIGQTIPFNPGSEAAAMG